MNSGLEGDSRTNQEEGRRPLACLCLCVFELTRLGRFSVHLSCRHAGHPNVCALN